MNREMTTTDSEELTFSRTFLGYDPLEVRAFVREANDRIARLSSQGTLTPDGNGEVQEAELSGTITSVVQEIDEVLESARLAAKRIRDTAEVDVSNSVESAHQQALQIVAEAEEEAFTLRQVAWEAATEMLEAVSSEVAGLRTEAERDALRIIDDAERRSMRKLAAARRDSENVLQTARLEYDRLVELANMASPGVDADRGDGAQAPVGEDSESVSTPTKRLVVEVPADDGLVEQAGSTGASRTYGAIRVIPAGSTPTEPPKSGESTEASGSDEDRDMGDGESAMRLGWADGTRSVRLVDTPATRARVEVDAVEMAREVARLRAGSENGDESESGEPAAVERPDRPDRPPEADVPARAGVRPGPGSALVKARGNRSGPSASAPSEDELATLFSRLRSQVERANAPA
jgi:cell division septum initiation protein DivIVA